MQGDAEKAISCYKKAAKSENILVASAALMKVGRAYESLGDFAAAEAIDKRLAELYRLIFVDGNPAGIKCVMELRGMLKNVLRLPLVPATQVTRDKIAAFL
jgi:dihydrodipicolinate synthase/N-acetylneuraminate lyase